MIKMTAFHDLLQKDVSRQEFLKYMGIGALTVVGIMPLLNSLTSVNMTPMAKKSTQGYGSTPYGH